MPLSTNHADPNCIFCKIVANLAPCHKIWEDEHYLAFLSIFPNTKGFTVVIPKLHLDSYIFDHSPAVINGLMAATKQVSDRLISKFSTASRTALIFEGYGVNHLHAKLIPLHGTKDGTWQHLGSSIKVRFDIYPGYVSSHDATRASDEELAEIADFLKK